MNFKELLNSNYNLDYINYVATLDLKDIPSGTYSLIMELNNNGKLDYYELTNDYEYSYDSLDFEGLLCEHRIDTVKSRMLVDITND